MLLLRFLEKMRAKAQKDCWNEAAGSAVDEEEETVLLRQKLDADGNEEGMAAGWLYGFKRTPSSQ